MGHSPSLSNSSSFIIMAKPFPSSIPRSTHVFLPTTTSKWIIWNWALYKWVMVKRPTIGDDRIQWRNQSPSSRNAKLFSLGQNSISCDGQCIHQTLKLLQLTPGLHLQGYPAYISIWWLRQGSFITAHCTENTWKCTFSLQSRQALAWQRARANPRDTFSFPVPVKFIWKKLRRQVPNGWVIFFFWPTELLVSSLKGRLDPK